MDSLTEQADIVIFDSPPVLAAADAVILASQMDGTIMVVETGATKKGAARRALQLLTQARATVLGVAYNKMRAQDGEGYYYYNYHYGTPASGDNACRRAGAAADRRRGSTLRMRAVLGERPRMTRFKIPSRSGPRAVLLSPGWPDCPALSAQAATSAGRLRRSPPRLLPTAAPRHASYVLSPDDQVDISVLGHDEFRASVTLLPDGTFNYPVLGKVHAAGLTVDGLTKTLVKGLSSQYNQPEVTVYLRQSRPRNVSVLGDGAKAAGQFEFRTGMHLLDLLAAAGGPATEAAADQGDPGDGRRPAESRSISPRC